MRSKIAASFYWADIGGGGGEGGGEGRGRFRGKMKKIFRMFY